MVAKIQVVGQLTHWLMFPHSPLLLNPSNTDKHSEHLRKQLKDITH